MLKIHKSKTPPHPFTPKKENEDTQNDKKKIEYFQTLKIKNKKNKKSPKVHKMKKKIGNKYHNKKNG
jgi:hypothetical protein